MESKFKVFIGIDVSKGWLDFAVFIPGKEGKTGPTERCANTHRAAGATARALIRRAGAPAGTVLFCLESTGIYCAPFLRHAAEAGLEVCVEAGWRATPSVPGRGKSDRSDAERLAEYAARFHDRLTLWTPLPADIARLKRLISVRGSLVRGRRRLAVQEGEARAMGEKDLAALLARAHGPLVAAFDRQIDEVERQMDEVLRTAPALQKNMALATSVPGVGNVTALALLVATANFTQFTDPRKLATHCGVAPWEHSSGSSVRGKNRVSHRADKNLKTLLHLAAVSSKRFDPEAAAYFERKKAEGKHTMSILNAIRNKVIHRILAVIRRQTPWARSPGTSAVADPVLTKENFVAPA